MVPLRWIEHLLAVMGLAWLANYLVEALAVAVGRTREAAKIEREVHDLLKRLGHEQQLLQGTFEAHPERTSFAAAHARTIQAIHAAGPSDVDRLKRHLQVVRWGSRLAWDLANETRHRDALAATYASAWKLYLLQHKTLTTDQLQRIAEAAAKGGQRPTDSEEALLFDMVDIYLQACRMGSVYARALNAVPMLLEESLKSPEATGQELFNRWQLRADVEAESYQPTATDAAEAPEGA